VRAASGETALPKLNIRLPEDDDHGPNPYDSKTNPKDLIQNRWLWDWKWWVGIISVVAGLALAEYLNGRLRF
jgi:hypothetical protein